MLSRGLDNNDLALPFAQALRQLQLSGSEEILEEVDQVIETLVSQTARREANLIDLKPLLETVRSEEPLIFSEFHSIWASAIEKVPIFGIGHRY